MMVRIDISAKLLITVILCFLSSLLYAQEIRDTLPPVTLDEVVITANRFNSIIMDTPEAIQKLGSKTMQRHQLRTVPESLKRSPAVFVQKTNHGGGSPFLRGLTGNQILLLIDGIRLSNAISRYGPNQYFNTIDLFSIDRIEILRGSGSVPYGSDAMGGTIQAFSHELSTTERPVWNGVVDSRLVTNGMEKSLHGGLTYSCKRVAFNSGLTWRSFGDIYGGDNTGRQTPSGYRELNYDLKGKIILSRKAELIMAYQNVNQSKVPVYHKVNLENYAINHMDPQRRQLGYIRINRKSDKGILKSFRLTASMQATEEGRISRKYGSSVLRTENDRVRSFIISSETVASNGDVWLSNTGVEINLDVVNSTRTDLDLSNDISIARRGLYPDGSRWASGAVFSVHTFDLPDWNFTVGARFNTFIITVEDAATGRTKLTPSALVGSMSALRKLDRSSNLFVSLNTGFRAPNIDDLGSLGIVDFRYEMPNYNLKPERSFQYQAGYKFQDDKVSGEFYLYRNELYDLIVRNPAEGETVEGYSVYQKVNTDRAFIQGIETAWEYSPGPAWIINGSLTYTYGQNKTLNEPVRRIPPVYGSLAVEYKLDHWWASLEWQAAGRQNRLSQGDMDDNRIPDGGTPGWDVLNFSAGFEMKLIEVRIKLQNLFNEDYRFHGSGINEYGRSACLSIRLNLTR
jgi:hemoglobin/transferrin/lactoferrin receptor protein